ncbi:MAG: endolytic transglycosylase MltG [Patescibacteria group bacterium]
MSPPEDFPVGDMATIEKGGTLSQITQEFKKAHIIRSSYLFKVFVVLFRGDRGVFAGDYFLEKPISVFTLALRVTSDDQRFTPITIIVPEGFTIFDIANLFEERFSKFDRERFLSLAPEGYLFPDTYLFLSTVRAEEVIAVMRENFYKKTESLGSLIASSTSPLEDIVSMASILEKEARTIETRRIIAGILWKRLSIDMPLQVDVSFEYINGKNSYELTTDDLAIDSPYNSYKYKGLPPTPISNPGLSALTAALTPIKTPYLYFLSDRRGVMHYARNFEEHKENRALYLD